MTRHRHSSSRRRPTRRRPGAVAGRALALGAALALPSLVGAEGSVGAAAETAAPPLARIVADIGCPDIASGAAVAPDAFAPSTHPSPVGVRYLIRTLQRGAGDVGATFDPRYALHRSRYAFYRRGATVLHDYVSAGITEAFTRTANGRVRMTRHFDPQSRSIEYDPVDRESLGVLSDWSRLSSMIDATARRALESRGTVGEGCRRVERLVREDERGRIELDWLPAWDVAVRYLVETPSVRREWVLEEHVADRARIDAEFARRDEYLATDFADIGDNESDPFLRSMIALGFVEHGASGFYDATGRDLGGGHAH